MPKRSKTSKAWLREHFNDPYVKRAQQEGLRSRAAYKLKELNMRDQFIRPGNVVVDLGAAPGGWSEVLVEWVGERGSVIALDVLPFDPIEGVTQIIGDFTVPAVLNQLEACLEGQLLDAVVSDMAPNSTGHASVDQPRSMYLAELAFDFACQNLKLGGHFLVKIFHGEGMDDYIRAVRAKFSRVVCRKPDASRSRSRETYLLALGKR